METKIKLKKNDVIKIGIEDENGNDTGEYLEFDLQDVSLPLKYQQAMEEHKKNMNYLKMSFALIDKKPDHQGKKLLSSNEEEKYKVILEFYKREMSALDLVIGEGGAKKLLNGRSPYYEMFNDALDYLEPIAPIFSQQMDNVKKKIIDKYINKKDDDVLEV